MTDNSSLGKDSQYQVVYFPYLFANNELIEFDGDILWNYSICAKERVENEELRNYISKFLDQNTLLGEPIKHIYVFKAKDKSDFTVLDEDDESRVNDLRAVLFLCYASRSNLYRIDHFSVTAENFICYSHGFKKGGEYAGFARGSILHKRDYGYNIGEIKFEAPLETNDNVSKKFDNDLFQEIDNLKKVNLTVYRSIITATHAFMSGYYNSDLLAYDAAILIQMSGFEILFCDTGMNKEKFMRHIMEYCLRQNISNLIYFESRKRDGTTKKCACSPLGKWANRFYELRNTIIHGRQPTNEDRFYTDDKMDDNYQYIKGDLKPHRLLALMFFVVAVKQKINEALGETIFEDNVRFNPDRGLEYERAPLKFKSALS